MPSESAFAIGPWRVLPDRGVLLRDGREVRLEPKLAELLLLFAGAPGRVISKDEIVTRLWSGRAIGDDTLAALVSRLRSALGETKSERYIETLPKRGYRLLVAPSGSEPAAPPARRDEVDDLIEKGKAALALPLAPSLAQANAFFTGAIARDPKSAEAHAGLAEVAIARLLASHEDASPQLAQIAKASAQAATALGENVSAGWSALGAALLLADRLFAPADAAFARALALEPGSAATHARRGFAFASIGRFVDAEREVRRAVELDPLSFTTRAQLLQVLLLARRYPQAIAEAKRALAQNAQSFEAWSIKGWAHAFSGDEIGAVDALREGLKLMGMNAASLQTLDAAHREGGLAAMSAAGADLFESQRLMFAPRPLDIALLRTQAGEFDKAFAALNVVAERDDPLLLFLPWLPHVDRLRNDPRFAVFLERVRLVH